MEIICKRCCQSNGCRHTRKKHRNSQYNSSHRTQQVTCHCMKQCAAVGKWRLRHCTDIRQHIIHNRKNQRRPGSAEQRVFDDILLFMYLKSADRIDDDNGKHQSCRTVQSIISFNHSLKERNFCICSPRGTDAAILNPAMR